MANLGFTHYFERTEYQARGSAHGHSLLWHPNAPTDAFLDVIQSTAKQIYEHEVKTGGGGGSGLDDGDGDRDIEWDVGEIADLATELMTLSPRLFVYEAGNAARDGSDFVFQPSFVQRIAGAEDCDAASLMAAVVEGQRASAWYAAMLDGSNQFFDLASQSVLSENLPAIPPSQVNPVEAAHTELNLPRTGHDDRDVLTLSPPDGVQYGSIDFWEKDYHQLRCLTGRHTTCTESYCLRYNPKTKLKDKCRFEDALKIRTVARPPELPDCNGLVPAGTHYYAEAVPSKSGKGDLIRWQI